MHFDGTENIGYPLSVFGIVGCGMDGIVGGVIDGIVGDIFGCKVEAIME